MRAFLTVLAIAITTTIHAQKNQYQGFPSLVWPKLYDVKYVNASDERGEYEKPVFSDATLALDGKMVTLPGYIVPFENKVKSDHLMLSSMPLNACFFCGVGGPETAVEVFLQKEIPYTDKPVEIKGVLRINRNDPDKMPYVLENAELAGELDL